MRAGELNKRVVILECKKTIDENKVSRQSWIDIKPVWCSIKKNSYRKNYSIVNQDDFSISLEFTIRWGAFKGITKKHRLKYKDKMFDIKFIDDITEEGRFIKIIAVEV